MGHLHVQKDMHITCKNILLDRRSLNVLHHRHYVLPEIHLDLLIFIGSMDFLLLKRLSVFCARYWGCISQDLN